MNTHTSPVSSPAPAAPWNETEDAAVRGTTEEREAALLTTDDFEAAHGEKLIQTLDLNTWLPGTDLLEMYARLEQEVGEAVQKESEYQREIRRKIFPMLRTREGAPSGAGVYSVTLDRLRTCIAPSSLMEP